MFYTNNNKNIHGIVMNENNDTNLFSKLLLADEH